MNQSHPSLGPDFEFIGGQSSVGRLSHNHPDNRHPRQSGHNIYPNDVTIEIYENKTHDTLGVVATRHLLPELSEQEQYTDAYSGGAANMYAELGFIGAVLSGNSQTKRINDALGLSLVTEEGLESREITVTTPNSINSINHRLKSLGIEDRKFVDFDGSIFGAKDYISRLANGEIPVASEGMSAFHDRAFHLIGHVLISPELFEILKTRAGNLLSTLNQVEETIGNKLPYELSGDESRNLYIAKEALGKFMTKLDFDIPNISSALASPRDEQTERRVRHHINELLNNYDEQGTEKEDTSHLVDSTYSWVAKLHAAAEN